MSILFATFRVHMYPIMPISPVECSTPPNREQELSPGANRIVRRIRL